MIHGAGILPTSTPKRLATLRWKYTTHIPCWWYGYKVMLPSCKFYKPRPIKHHQTSSNIIKHHQTSSNIIKHHQTIDISWWFIGRSYWNSDSVTRRQFDALERGVARRFLVEWVAWLWLYSRFLISTNKERFYNLMLSVYTLCIRASQVVSTKCFCLLTPAGFDHSSTPTWYLRSAGTCCAPKGFFRGSLGFHLGFL